MGFGGYLATKSQTEHFDRERERERAEVAAVPEAEAGEVLDALQAWGLTDAEAAPVVTALRRRPESWVDFMMRFELGLERPDPARALTSAVTIGGAYVAGGLLPLVPYMLVSRAGVGLAISCLVTLAALFAFGFFKGRFTRVAAVKSGLQTVVVGGVAAAAAFALARLISGA
ncbi:MAG: VIT1/CCC1 transporter family protein, partial [Candidatus Dormibacterales bacterium]